MNETNLNRKSLWLLLLLAFSISSAATGDEKRHPTVAQLEFFEKRIRPVLVEQCYACHNSTKRAAGGLAVDHRTALLKGGDRGVILVPGKPAKSRLLAILRHDVPDLKMPQDAGKLSAAVIADFAKWISQGAPDPRSKPPSASELAKATAWETTFATRKKWWSFQPVKRYRLPPVKNKRWSDHPVDRFILSKLEQQSLRPALQADKRTLLRRATFALIGLPPTPRQVQAFLADKSPTAFETVVTRLMNTPQFGERWARHWMDVVRYCESHGSQGDPALPYAFRYRDYLIRAFNADVPYDQLVREHLAGDLLRKPRWNTRLRLNESALGTAQLRMVELGFVPVDALDDQVKVVENQIDVYSKAFLGLTASCARCHNHKFDPISQQDFYALYGVFVSGRPGQLFIDSPEILDKNRAELARLKTEIRSELANAWLAAAASFNRRLQQHKQHQTIVTRLQRRLNQLRQGINKLEGAARARLAKSGAQRGTGSLPVPDARWSFQGNAQDSAGSHHGKLLGGAKVERGRLVLNGVNATMQSAALTRDISEKTLEAWVSLANLSQRGCGVIGLDTPAQGFFDSIVFGEKKPGHWMAGSDYFRRTQIPGGPRETTPPGKLIHVAIVYAKDNSITVYRNGIPYGKSYRKGKLHTFRKSTSRFLFGQRLTGVNPPLAGEIEEARAYYRALSASEIANSFRAGAEGFSPEQLAKVMTPDQRRQLAKLRTELTTVNSALKTKENSNLGMLTKALIDARSNTANPLHLWQTLLSTQASSQRIRSQWNRLADYWQTELKKRRHFNNTRFTKLWDLTGDDRQTWVQYGTTAAHSVGGMTRSVKASRNGEFSVLHDGEHVIKGIHPAGIYSHPLTRRHAGMLTSPRFVITTDSISIRAAGKESWARLVIENNPKGNGGIYPATKLNQEQVGWLRFNTAYRKGARAYVEFLTVDGNFGNPANRGFYGACEIVASDHSQVPQKRTVPIRSLLRGSPPESVAELADRYADELQRVIRAWRNQSLSDDDTAFLDHFLRSQLLPTRLQQLPRLRKTIERYRQLERGIRVPQRSPGLVDGAGFDQPLFVRGQHTKPGPPVRRRGLSVLSDRPFVTKGSGRLQLARQTASANNPLTARVMVNRLWHHLFGRGIVATVDNFGRLGEKPTHPQLLDYLAWRFAHQEKWSIKRMIRLLITSRTWRQASVVSQVAGRIDPDNRWLSHMSVRRLDAEAIRDAILASSGQLDPRQFGPGAGVYFVKKTENGGRRKGPLDGNRRRSVYLQILRNAHNPFLEVFDAPKPTTTRGRRDVTNVPAQSLTMLNGPFVIDQAKKWATKVIKDGLKQPQRVRTMFQIALGRQPDQTELSASLAYLKELATEYQVPPTKIGRAPQIWQDFAQSLFCLKEFIYVR